MLAPFTLSAPLIHLIGILIETIYKYIKVYICCKFLALLNTDNTVPFTHAVYVLILNIIPSNLIILLSSFIFKRQRKYKG